MRDKRQLAIERRSHGMIRANTISPGVIENQPDARAVEGPGIDELDAGKTLFGPPRPA
jgi:hypothetical protein